MGFKDNLVRCWPKYLTDTGSRSQVIKRSDKKNVPKMHVDMMCSLLTLVVFGYHLIMYHVSCIIAGSI